ncbi:hypothetical protein ABW20_dc0102071 [Dactylellina cionopaga]|nr:hypothetical protein ABW20_dc0102071 [Dactylellina cionopaga]
MKICVLHSSNAKVEASTEGSVALGPNPGLFTSQHSFENKYIIKATAKAQIDEAVAEGYDFYFNFLWGTDDDDIAGVEAIRYFESFNLPFAGVQSSERQRSKFDFFADAKRLGSLPIPGADNFPLFLKPAFDCASRLIDENSLCRNEAELESAINRLNPKMRSQRLRRAAALREDPEEYVFACEAAGRHSNDLVIQEFIDGEEYSVSVFAMGHLPVALTPMVAKHGRKLPGKEQFLTFDIKYDVDSGYELLNEDQNPELYQELQAVAMKAFEETQSHTGNIGCEVDLRVRRDDNKPFIIEVDPLPIWFLPPGTRDEDLDVQHDFPGGHRAAINTFITNYYVKNSKTTATLKQSVEDYDALLPHHEHFTPDDSDMTHITQFCHGGTVLDLACKNGFVGRTLLSEQQQSAQRAGLPNLISCIIGVDFSDKMIQLCRQGGWYNELFLEGVVSFLARYNQKVDHIFLLSGIHLLSVEELDFVLVRCFQLANCSIMLMNSTLAQESIKTQASVIDHAANIKSFGEPRGWQLVYHNSRATGIGTCAITFRFERKIKAGII